MIINRYIKRITAYVLTLSISLSMLFILSACELSTVPYTELAPVHEPEPIMTPEQDPVINVERVDIRIENSIVERGTFIKPVVNIYPENATDQSYILYTYDTNVLRKTEQGFLAIGSGDAEIIVLAADGVTNWIAVKVIVSARRITFAESEITLNVGENHRLSPNIFPLNATNRKVIYSSSDELVATVSTGGIIRALSPGETTITCSVDDAAAEITVNVIIPAVTITVSTDRNIYAVGAKGILTVEFNPENTTERSFEVSFSDGASPEDHNTFVVTGAGEITITVTTTGGLTARTKITAVDLDVLAEEVFNLTNFERRDAGLTALTRNRTLTRVAGARALEIVEYFSHTRPDGRSWDTIFLEFNIRDIYAGENLAMGHRNAAEVVAGWMASQTHRDNILDSDFTRIGIGVTIDQDGTLYWTQLFTNQRN